MSSKIILVTGSTDGLGKQMALDLAKQGATVILHGRSEERVSIATTDIRQQAGKDVHLDSVIADISTLAGVQSVVGQVKAKYDRLDVLINNAGVFMKERVETSDGFEMSLAVNYLAGFWLTQMFKPLLVKSGSGGSPSRVIFVTSVAHQRVTIDFQDIQSAVKFDGFNAYSVTKLANIMLTYELAERWKALPVSINCFHPGIVSTKLLKTGFNSVGSSVQEGADTGVFLATSPKVEGVSGKYFIKHDPQVSSPASMDAAARKQLWHVSEQLTGVALLNQA